jgi:hypothetical protein
MRLQRCSGTALVGAGWRWLAGWLALALLWLEPVGEERETRGCESDLLGSLVPSGLAPSSYSPPGPSALSARSASESIAHPPARSLAQQQPRRPLAYTGRSVRPSLCH